MGTDVDINFLFHKISIVFERSWLFFKIENQTRSKIFVCHSQEEGLREILQTFLSLKAFTGKVENYMKKVDF